MHNPLLVHLIHGWIASGICERYAMNRDCSRTHPKLLEDLDDTLRHELAQARLISFDDRGSTAFALPHEQKAEDSPIKPVFSRGTFTPDFVAAATRGDEYCMELCRSEQELLVTTGPEHHRTF